MNNDNKKPLPKEYVDLLDMDRILASTDDKDRLKVTLKKDPIKGTGVYAVKPIKKGEVISYYKMTVRDYRRYESPTNHVYAFEVYTKAGNESKFFIGDLDLDSIPKPLNNIPYWAPFVNEPSGKQTVNAEIDTNLKEIYATRKIMKPGVIIVYKLVALKNIKPNEEVTIYYGKEYVRNYEIHI